MRRDTAIGPARLCRILALGRRTLRLDGRHQVMYQGTGIYTLPEAARLIRVPAQKMHRWLYGYPYAKRAKGETSRGYSEPLWAPQLSKEELTQR